jgi:hypothetical protein
MVDDGFFLWDGTEEELKQFIQHCNDFHPTIQFTFEYRFECKSVNLLDMIIWMYSNGFIQTDLFLRKLAGKTDIFFPAVLIQNIQVKESLSV